MKICRTLLMLALSFILGACGEADRTAPINDDLGVEAEETDTTAIIP